MDSDMNPAILSGVLFNYGKHFTIQINAEYWCETAIQNEQRHAMVHKTLVVYWFRSRVR